MAVLLLLSSSAFFAAGDRDWFETDCDGATFHFRTLDATSGGQKFVFRLSLGNLHFIPELMGGNWLDAKVSDALPMVNARKRRRQESG